MQKVWGEENPADAMTKNVGGEKLRNLVNASSQEYRSGRAKESLQLKIGTNGS